MIYIFVLLVYNILTIILLSNVRKPSKPDLFNKKLPRVMRLKNSGISISEIEINKYHSLYKDIEKTEESAGEGNDKK